MRTNYQSGFSLLLVVLLGMGVTWQLNAQAVISGVVRSSDGESLPFASIYIQGTTRGTTSNAEGAYALEVEPGTYNVVFQYIGYKSEIANIEVPPKGTIRNVSLQEEVLSLQEIEVAANREDPAYEIIRKAQSQRKKYRDRVKSYEANSYIKGVFKLKDAPNKLFGQEIGAIDILDSVFDGYVYLSESVSKVYYEAPDKFKEVMISSIVSGDPQGFSFNQATGMNFNFYENTIEFGRSLVSPIASNAMDFYKYRLESVSFDAYGNMVNRISVIPKNQHAAVFGGTIYITEDLWNIHDIDLYTTGKAVKSPVIDTLWIKQLFVPTSHPEGEEWMIFNHQINLELGALGFKLRGEFSGVFSDYKINVPIDKGLFDENKIVVEKGANERDSSYWESIRPIPLTQSEVRDYVKKDSVQMVLNSPEFLDSTDRDHNKFGVLSILTGYSYRKTRQGITLYYNSPITSLGFNPIQGLYGAVGVGVEKRFKNPAETRINFSNSYQYGFADRRVNPKLELSINWDPIYKQKLKFGWYRGLNSYDPAVPIPPEYALFLNLFWKEHYLKLFREQGFYGEYEGEIGRGFKATVKSRYTGRNSVINRTEKSSSDRNRPYPRNMPLEQDYDNFPYGEQIIAGVDLSWRPGMHYLLFPNNRISLGTAYPTLGLSYEKSIPINDFGGDWDKLIFTVSKSGWNFGSWGYTNLSGRIGHFLNSSYVPLPDIFHFNGNEIPLIQNRKYMDGFLRLPYFSQSGVESYGTIHWEHHFDGFLFDKIPLVRRLGWKMVTGYARLQQSGGGNWNEIIIGVENIGISIYRGLRVNSVASWQDGQPLVWSLRLSI